VNAVWSHFEVTLWGRLHALPEVTHHRIYIDESRNIQLQPPSLTQRHAQLPSCYRIWLRRYWPHTLSVLLQSNYWIYSQPDITSLVLEPEGIEHMGGYW
jgi:hypothetical protein